MKIINPHLNDSLDELIEIVLRVSDPVEFDRTKPHMSIDLEEACSDAYFEKQIELNKTRFPLRGVPDHHLGSDLLLNVRHSQSYPEVKPLMQSISQEIMAKKTALISYYPKDGYIAWHHNADVPGRNLLFTWSETGDGFFKFRNPVTGADETIKDVKGWSAKSIYYYGHQNAETTGYSWHCAGAKCRRFTMAYVIAIPRETDRHGRITNEPNTDPIYWADLLADNFKIAKIIDGLHYM